MKQMIILLATHFICIHICYSQNKNLIDYLPKKHVLDGSVDYSKYLQQGLNENLEVTFPNFPILINENGLNLRNNQILHFLDNSLLIIKPNSNESYGILNLKNVSNVVINNPNLEGDKDKHINAYGEWGMGINILSSEDIIIKNPRISKCWGDGIYIGEINYKERKIFNLKKYYSRNIKILGGVLDNNRRNGISIISVKRLLIDGTLIQNTEGTLPMSGIDIEPNNNEQYLEDILISNVITKNNSEIGIKYVPSNFFGQRKKRICIIIDNCIDIGSKIGLFVGGARTPSFYKNGIAKFDGEIIIKNFVTYSNETPYKFGSIQKYSPNINIESFSIYNRTGKRKYKNEKKLKFELKKINSTSMD